ncbi:site-specific DNA-methyltransferase [Turicibacter sanguinis]|uniref:site-specific DNA-methyltransferase n=2 Tax=Turicibacter sanguinis TaxID=154288 RepID=UPI00232E8D94|nr:site-specific DNA-methyltransferase [Turicibacter sanguinis]MDB8460421.1 site-specific DNA-methyltransferase [Turicibacter sanguinis]
MEKMTGESLDLTQENIKRLKELFPEVLTEKKIDFDKLRLILGDEVETSPERYEFRWNGKNEAIKLSQTPSMGTLRPDKESSKNWDTTENLYIEGDNLEVLKLLQKSYFGKIKMIYIDPPYNTGKDFVYKDNFHDNIANYKEITNQSTKANPETNGRFHTDWLNMMYPRLRLARNLLKEDGVIFISIGQVEIDNLIKCCNEIFGETNKVGIVSRVMKSGGGKGQFFSPNMEYILVYAKNIIELGYFREPISEDIIKKLYTSIETEGPKKGEKYRPFGLYQSSLDPMRGCSNQRYYIEAPDGTLLLPPGNSMPKEAVDGAMVVPTSAEDKVWRWSRDRYLSEKEKGNIVFKESKGVLIQSDGNPASWNVYTKIWLSDRQEEGMVPVDLINKWENRQSSKELQELGIQFDFAKPVGLINYLLQIVEDTKDAIILDFFSGSATTAHAVMQSNMDNGNRKYIMVQIPEEVGEQTEAYKSGYENICEIGKERIRRAGDNIARESQGIDIGFKVFKLDDSNIKTWNPSTKDLENTLFNSIQNLKEDRTKEDLLYELLLKLGIELTAKVEEINVDGKVIYNIQSGGLVICLEDDLTKDVIDYIPKLKSPFMEMKVVFKEYGFKSDADKMNAIQNLKQHGIKDVRSV